MTFPALHSVLRPDALAELVGQAYGPGGRLTAEFLKRGLSDTYLVSGLGTERKERAVLRVYRTHWRSAAEVGWELGFIEHVAARGVRVSRPWPRRSGELFGTLEAAEGPRLYALFDFLPGRALRNVPEDAAQYGALTADLHSAADSFQGEGRFALDLDHLITEPLRTMRPLLGQWPELERRTQAAAEQTHARLSALAPELSWGACHGDLHEGNARLAEGGKVGLFDFDCAGPGYRAYDLAVYWWSQVSSSGKSVDESQAVWDAFLSAYQTRRPLSEADRAALPLFVAARSLWFMGLIAGLSTEYGSETWGEEFFGYGADFLDRWEKQTGV